MRSTQHGRISLFAALVVFFAVPTICAQDAVRVARLSRAEGQVFVSHSGSNTVEQAPVNLPLQEGDTLSTQGGLAEIEFENGATAYLADNSILQITQLGFTAAGRATDLDLTQGAATFYANLTNQDIFRVVTLTFNVAIPERAEFRVDGFPDGAAVEVLLGNVAVSTSTGSINLERGQSVAVHQKDFNDFSVGSLPNAEDAFDQWVTEQGEIIRSGNKNTLTYVNSPNSYGLSDLSIYGSWVNLPGFGYSWRPFSVGLSWAPYFNGKWILDPRLGWIWISNEPWGWMPYHFGSWLLSPGIGWVWVPGGPAGLRQWQPSLVNWVRVGNQVGWVAKSPNDHDGAAANAAQGIVTRPVRVTRNADNSNELVTGKELQTVASLKQPSQDFALSFQGDSPHLPRPGRQLTARVPPWTVNNNSSIVLDQRTHTFINRDSAGEAGAAGNANSAPFFRRPVVPRSSSQPTTPRVAIPPTALTDSRNNPAMNNRVILPPPYPAVPPTRGSVPAQVVSPALPQRSLPTAPQRTAVPPVSPRPVTSPAPGARYNPSQRQPAQAQTAPAVRSGTRTPTN